jgi:hypothetical protein
MYRFPNGQSRNTSYQLIGNLVGSFSLKCNSGVATYISKEKIPDTAEGLRLIMNEFLNEELILYKLTRNLVDSLSPECDPGVFIYIPNEIIPVITNCLLSTMELSLNKEQTPNKIEPPISYTLRIYSVGSSLMNLPDDGKEYVSEGFTKFPLDIIRYIANYLDDFDIRALKQVSKPILAIMRREWPSILFYVALWSNGMIEYSQGWDLYNFGTKLYKKRATNNYMDPMCHFEGIIDQYPPHKTVIDPSRWTSMRLKGGTNNYLLNQSWADYIKECVNLVHLELIDTSDIYLESVNLKRLERFFMKFKSVNGWMASITLPSSMKAPAMYASEGNDQERHTQPSKRYVNKLDPGTLECTQLELW